MFGRCFENPVDRETKSAITSSDILDGRNACFMIELITVLKTPVAHGLWI